ncbi:MULTISPECIES: hypothetical protein, partial [unclassified Microcoleus]|uniref:hypothetical protein n=1 Tax=unclassified Microcoleus TaxID=2642155 RepID=UPI002FCEB484
LDDVQLLLVHNSYTLYLKNLLLELIQTTFLQLGRGVFDELAQNVGCDRSLYSLSQKDEV